MTATKLPFHIMKTRANFDESRSLRERWTKEGWSNHEFLGYHPSTDVYIWKVSKGNLEHV